MENLRKNKLTIVVITYNRLTSLKRLLNSLENAEYNDMVNLVISIDFGENEELISYVKEFNWKYGEKKVIVHKENMGLKKHVMYCGGLSQKLGTICVFEDDIIVSPDFYEYSIQLINRYENEDNIAGYSLYKHSYNIENMLPFTPIKSSYDVFMMQYAMSWGQIWTSKQWNDFYKWYKKNENEDLFFKKEYPKHLSTWSDKSWLKYHIKYCIDKKKYFVYPYESLSSNFGDIGTHAVKDDSTFQVSLQYGGTNQKLNLPDFSECTKYDCFFELEEISGGFKKKPEDLEFDIYGEKEIFSKRYILSSQILDYKVLKKYDLTMKPQELNYFFDIKGDDFYLYDTEISEVSNKRGNNNKLLYYMGNPGLRRTILLLKNIVFQKIRGKK